jgi:hypothetical protein
MKMEKIIRDEGIIKLLWGFFKTFGIDPSYILHPQLPTEN